MVSAGEGPRRPRVSSPGSLPCPAPSRCPWTSDSRGSGDFPGAGLVHPRVAPPEPLSGPRGRGCGTPRVASSPRPGRASRPGTSRAPRPSPRPRGSGCRPPELGCGRSQPCPAGLHLGARKDGTSMGGIPGIPGLGLEAEPRRSQAGARSERGGRAEAAWAEPAGVSGPQGADAPRVGKGRDGAGAERLEGEGRCCFQSGRPPAPGPRRSCPTCLRAKPPLPLCLG